MIGLLTEMHYTVSNIQVIYRLLIIVFSTDNLTVVWESATSDLTKILFQQSGELYGMQHNLWGGWKNENKNMLVKHQLQVVLETVPIIRTIKQNNFLTIPAHLEKFARLCMVLATSVVFRDTFSVGSCCVNPNSVGERIAGHINRRKTHELTSWSQTSWLRWLWQRCRSAENTRFSSLQFIHIYKVNKCSLHRSSTGRTHPYGFLSQYGHQPQLAEVTLWIFCSTFDLNYVQLTTLIDR